MPTTLQPTTIEATEPCSPLVDALMRSHPDWVALAAQFAAGETVAAGWLGVRLDANGAVVAVADGAPAAAAGIEAGDTVYAVDGKRTTDADALLGVLQAHAPGDPITVTVERHGRTFDVGVTLGAPPAGG